MSRRVVSGTAAALLLLAGCSGGDNDSEDEQPEQTSAPLPEIEGPITEPGEMYLDPLEASFPAEDAADSFGYVFDEFFVSGTAADEPYRVRVGVARPGPDAEPFSGNAIVEAIHPQGIPFVWNFTREHLMAEGHAAVSISVFPNTVDMLEESNSERYADLRVATDADNDNSNIDFDHASDIYAQVGRLLKNSDTPLPGVERLYMTGHSMSVGPVWQYMDTHHARYRLADGDPIYDGFFPETTRTASRMGPFPPVDVPTLLINSELEAEVVLVEEAIDYRRPDSDEPGEQFRLYEVPGMPHNPSWMHPLLLEGLDIKSSAAERCANPLNSFPYNPMVSMALEHLIRWVGDDVAPPRADRIELTGEVGEQGVAIRRDEYGNALGGVRTTTLDVPVAAHQALNEPLDPAQDLSPGGCLVFGTQLDFPQDELVALYGDKQGYVAQVERRLDGLVEDGWYLEEFADHLRDQADAFNGFG